MMATGVLPEGWMGKQPRRWLAHHARKSRRIIEVGVWLGRSTKVLASRTKGTVWAVDTWEGTPADEGQHKLYAPTLASRDPYAEFCTNLAGEIALGKVVPVRARSVEAASRLFARYGQVFDFIFIDADHSYEGARADIAAYLPLVKQGGLLSGHDYHWPGVKQAADEAFGTRLRFGPGSIWGLRP